MGIERIVSLTVTRQTGARGLSSQGYPVVVTNDPPETSFGSDRVKRYSINGLTSVKTDFGTNSATAKAFQAAASQSPKVKYIYVAKRDDASGAVATITIGGSGALLSGQTASVAINGTVVSAIYATSSAATLTAWAVSIAAVEGIASAVSSGAVITVTATDEWALTVGDATVSGSGTHPTFATAFTDDGRTIADDIADLFAENKNPYLIYLTSAVKGTILAAAPYAETLKKACFAQTSDAGTLTSATDDVGSKLKAADFTRTAAFYTSDTTKHWPLALAALCLAYSPGGVMFNGKTLAGVVPDDLTDDQIGHLEDKNINNYCAVLGDEGMTLPGVMADGNQIHATRDQDYFQSTLEGRLGNVFRQNPKVTINARGLKLFEGAGQAVFNQMTDEHVFDAAPPATWTAPDPADIPEEDQTAHDASGFYGNGKIENAAVRISANIDIQV